MGWVAKHPEVAALQPLARAAVERVRTPESELLELWQEDETNPADHRAWQDALADLLTRLG